TPATSTPRPQYAVATGPSEPPPSGASDPRSDEVSDGESGATSPAWDGPSAPASATGSAAASPGTSDEASGGTSPECSAGASGVTTASLPSGNRSPDPSTGGPEPLLPHADNATTAAQARPTFRTTLGRYDLGGPRTRDRSEAEQAAAVAAA